jgi:hypothetical protein
MANPQLEDGYLRIANEVWNQLMMSKFNREQRGIIDLIIRLSWGCGKKWAHIPRQKDFCLAGVYESHVKQELKWLEKANVIRVDWEQRLFQFNKYYTEWRVSIVAGYDEERLTELVAQNLQRSKMDGESTYKEVRNDLLISKNETENLQISKIELTNKEDLRPANQHGDNVRVPPKDILKDNTTTATAASPSSVFEEVLGFFCEILAKPDTSFSRSEIIAITNMVNVTDGDVDLIKTVVMDRMSQDKDIRSARYFEGPVKDAAEAKRVREEAGLHITSRGGPPKQTSHYDHEQYNRWLEEAGINATGTS